MPELPEVETTLRGIQPHIHGKKIVGIEVRNGALRWPVPSDDLQALVGVTVDSLERRAKYIFLHTQKGSILLHLGMSGSLRILGADVAPDKHDHIDIFISTQKVLRLNDPRRFGCCLLVQQPVNDHKLLIKLGPEPLSETFDGAHLFRRSRNRVLAIKNFIMDGKVVVGVGNIYASEALFAAGIRPTAAAERVSRKKYQVLAEAIKTVLQRAIIAGGTTLNDFTQADGQPGYFGQQLNVYGRSGEACLKCNEVIRSKVIGQRNTFYCPKCQSYPS
jgi:formamidopyrimidine-DNA glycosylase